MMSHTKLHYKAYSNAAPLASIHSLPPELLFDIFTLVAETTGFCRNRCCYDSSWIGITHVCRHWRQVAQSGARFWSHIVFDPEHLEVEQTMLRRSGGLATSIHAKLDSKVAQVVKSALAISPHVQELDVRADQLELDVLSQGLRNLSHFTLRVAEGDDPQTQLNLDPSHFSTNLQRLELIGVHPRLLAFTNPTPPSSLNSTLRPLASFTKLRHLFINHDGWNEFRIEGMPDIHFTNIEYLGIQGRAMCCIDMLRAFHFPKTTRLFCALSHFNGQEAHAETIASLLSGYCERVQDMRPITVMHLEGYEDDHLRIPNPINSFKILCYHNDELLCDFRLINVRRRDFPNVWFQPLWDYLPLENVQRLRLFNAGGIDVLSWMRRTTPLPQLAHIDIRHGSSLFFHQFSRQEKPPYLNFGQIPFSERAFLLYPVLDSINFSDVDLAEGGHIVRFLYGLRDGPYRHADRRFSTYFLRFLKQRTDLGHPIKAVKLDSCRNASQFILRNISKVARVEFHDLQEVVYPGQFLQTQKGQALLLGREPAGGFIHLES